MKTIIDKTTKKLLYAVTDDNFIIQDNEIIIDELCIIENSEEKQIYFNETTREFYEP